jgi:hypothetical protein
MGQIDIRTARGLTEEEAGRRLRTEGFKAPRGKRRATRRAGRPECTAGPQDVWGAIK